MTEKQLENRPLTKTAQADSLALEKLQRESEELYKKYPPAKLYTKDSLVEESKHLFKEGQLLPDRFVLKLEANSSVLSQVDAVVKAVRTEIEKAYPGSVIPASNYYAINESKSGSQYAYVGIVGSADSAEITKITNNADTASSDNKLERQTTYDKFDDGYDGQKRVCIGLPSYTPMKVVEEQVDALFLRSQAAALGLPESATWKEIDARSNQLFEQERQLDYPTWSQVLDQRQTVRDAYTRPYQDCINRYWQSHK